jgi:CubicO group peptidase (beta-lactamase class C family)
VTSATGSGSKPAPVGDATPEQYSATPIPQAQTTAAIGKLDGIADDVMNRTGIPGMAIAVVNGEKVFYAKGFGVRELGTREIDEQTVFQLPSVSKSTAFATAVAKVVPIGFVCGPDMTGRCTNSEAA